MKITFIFTLHFHGVFEHGACLGTRMFDFDLRRRGAWTARLASMGFVSAWLFTGCGLALQRIPLAASTKPLVPRAASAVDLYVSGRPSVPTRDLALLTVEEESVYAARSEAEALERLRDEAGRIGCDGLVLLGPSGGVGSGIDGKHARNLRGFRGACIEYLAPPAP
jgi:hypothetical protein